MERLDKAIYWRGKLHTYIACMQHGGCSRLLLLCEVKQRPRSERLPLELELDNTSERTCFIHISYPSPFLPFFSFRLRGLRLLQFSSLILLTQQQTLDPQASKGGPWKLLPQVLCTCRY